MTTQNPVYASQAKPWLKYYDQKFIDQTLPALSAFEYVCQRSKNHLNDTALEYYGRKFAYADLIVNVKKTAAALRGAGVKKGDIITVVSIMTPEIIALFYAADMMGATLNLVDPRYSVEGIREYIEEVDSHLLVCLNVVYERCRQAAKRTNVEKVIVLSPADSLPPVMAVGYKLTTPDKNKYASNVIRWKQFIKGGEGQSTAAEPYDPDHACVVVHTGGTTGSPKGVMLTDDCFNGIALQFQAYPKLFHRGQKLMNVMPPFIAYGFACGIHLPLVLGFTVIIIPNLDPAKLGSLVLKHKPEHMFGVPTHYQQLASDPKLRDKDLSFIINYAAGGDSLSRGAEQTVNDFLAAHGARYPIAKGYGMTEVSSAATVAAGLDNKPGSVGIPMVDTVVAAFEPGTDQELPIGQRGELCISGPCLMKGYYNKPEETAILLRRHPDGRVWAHTGDMGYLDEDGFVYLDSRIKRMIIRHDGFKVFPSMIENVVSRHPAVHQCSVVGCTDKDHTQGRLPFVYIVLKADITAKKKQVIRELERMCAEELPEYVQPVAYKFISSMPMTPVGKVDYRQLEADISPRDY
ncbi:long-chain fatty acid--CoA ligase [Faecalibacterium prausnitzii]|uniref:Long-chain fatty acid--CoA ligase n=1 Tax=Faecalibacterium prausnitzii TaxID=853 RepID=A0A329TU61_9FIRM|nr:class I adenylate-forming enzyme family protein [Faecalibacterium prausnitzii]RAW53577.1 long-chain fatty acid--CoA ligase [Faecalibacterium prausnitzii]